MSPADDRAGRDARSGRAAPLPPDERRAAILAAVQPLLLERGVSVTTRELAEAAGVAEGTLFRVFADKLTLIGEAAFDAVDPAAMIPLIDRIDRDLPLAERLVTLMDIGMARIGQTIRWMSILHELGSVDPRPAGERDAAAKEGWARWLRRQTESEGGVRAAATRLFEVDEPMLGAPAEHVAELFNVVLLGASMRVVDARRRGLEPVPLATGTLVDMFLHGVLAPAGTPDAAPSTPATGAGTASPDPVRVV